MSPRAWRPTAQFATLELRAALLRAVRDYFAGEGVLEVETPVLAAAAVTDVHLASLRTHVTGHGDFHLQTSPEYAMKRLLAAGARDIYQVARVFRDAERGPRHNPEFTLIEWYRLGFDADALMDDAARLLHRLFESVPGSGGSGVLGVRRLAPPERLSYATALERYAGVDALNASLEELRAAVHRHGIELPRGAALDRDACLDLLVSTVVGPKLGPGRLAFLHDYPASQAALARLNPADARVAERFEIFLEGLELANGFHELANATEQRARFGNDLHERERRGLPLPAADERLLAALEHGLPDCSGIALGFDRVVMLACGAPRIDDVIAFPIELA